MWTDVYVPSTVSQRFGAETKRQEVGCTFSQYVQAKLCFIETYKPLITFLSCFSGCISPAMSFEYSIGRLFLVPCAAYAFCTRFATFKSVVAQAHTFERKEPVPIAAERQEKPVVSSEDFRHTAARLLWSLLGNHCITV